MNALLQAERDASLADGRGTSARARMLLEFVRELERQEIPYCVLRGEQHFPEPGAGSDLDLLTEPGRVHEVAELAAALARRHGVSVWERRRMGFMEQVLLYVFDEQGEHQFFGVDVHGSEACFGVPFLEARTVLARTRRERGLVRPERALAACINALGAWLASGCIPPRHAAAFAEALREEPAQIESLLAQIFGRAHARAMLAEPELARAWPLARLRWALLARAFARAPLSSARSLLAYAWAVRLRPLARPRGRMIAFLGTDGSGKSSVLEAVRALLEPAFRRERLHVFHLRPGLLPQINALFHGGRTSYTLADMAAPHRARPSGYVGSALRAAYYGADYVLGYALRVLPLRRRSVLVAFDRYIDDYQVDPLRSRIRLDLPGLGLLCRLVPRPDHVFVCSAPLETLRARKQELPEAESARQLQQYEQLARRLPRARLVRTKGSVREAADFVVRSIFEEPRA